MPSLGGYRGMGPVRVGNQAFEHVQHDVYGNAVLAASQAFFDTRLLARPGLVEFERLEWVGERAFAMHDQPDAGMWELRTMARVHSSSSLMCWAACDRLAKIATHLGRTDRAGRWPQRADTVRRAILERAWNPGLGAFANSFDGDALDASLLRMAEVGFIDPRDIDIHHELESLSGSINSEYSEVDWTPLRCINRSFSRRVLAGLFRLARIGLVTSLRDGMNLVAKECVAAQSPDNPGVLVLSRFCGAAHRADGALIVNPYDVSPTTYDVQGVADALQTSLDMPLAERKARWRTLIEEVRRNDVAAWRESFLGRLCAVR